MPGAAGTPGRSGFVRRQGMQLVDAAGAPVTLRGINLGGWLLWEAWMWGGLITDPNGNSETRLLEALTELVGADETAAFRDAVYARYITEADIERIAELGYNAVRVPVNHRLLETDAAPYEYRDAGFAVLDSLLDWCERHGVYVVLDMHAAPGGQSLLFVSDPDPENLWTSPELQARTVALWRALAERYAGRAIVAGYDLLNEPGAFDSEALVALYGEIAAAIREVDTEHLLLVEGNWASTDFDIFPGPLDANMAYSPHQYAWSADIEANLADAVRQARAHGVPLWIGEYGEDSAAVVGMQTDTYRNTPEVVGWAAWTWKRTDTGEPVPQRITPPLGWSSLMLWVTSPDFTSAPTPDQARAAMAAFLNAIELEACQQDEGIVGATL